MCLEPRTGANLPNTEVFINACLAWALALWLAAPVNELSRRRCVAIAMLFALASLYKQVAAATAAFVAVAHVMAAPPEHRRRAVRQVLGMAAVGLLVWAAVMGYFIATGRGWLAWQTLFVAPRAYAGGRMLENIAWSIIPQKGTAQYLFFALPALLLTVVAALLGTRAAPRRVWLMFAGLVVGTHVALVLPGAFHWHYYQLWFVPLSIGAGWGAAGLLNLLGPRRRPLAYVVVALALLAMIAPQASWYKLDGREWARRKYGDFFIYAHDAFRAASNEHLAPGETFYTWSDEAYAYPVTSRRPPATALWKMHTTTGPLADWLTRRTLADLQKNPPAMIILYGDQPDPPGHLILEWTRQHYDLVPDPRRRFFPLTIYVRR